MGIDRTTCRRGVPSSACAWACVALAAGCTTGPDFVRPADPAPPPQWAALAASAAAQAPAPASAPDLPSRTLPTPFDGRRWWQVFRDPVLDGLVDDALHQNLDLQTAAWRIAEARAQRQATIALGQPSVGASGLAGRQRASENGLLSSLAGASGGAAHGAPAPPPPSPWGDLFEVGFDASWELDLWGKVRRGVEAADASVLAAEQARGDAAVSLTAEVARTYLQLRGARLQEAIAHADIDDQRRLLALTESRARSGFTAQADVVRQQAQLAALEAELPPIAQEIDREENALALLLALPPGALHERMGAASGELAPLPPEVPVGLPGDLLRRRPDVLAAEADLHAATARIGVAQAQLFPTVQIGGFAGLQSVHADTLTDWASRFGLGGVYVTIPLFEGGRLKSQIATADARAREAALAWRKTVLVAYHEANQALFAYAQEQRHTLALVRELEHARRARDLTRERWRSGFVSQIEVIDAERQVHQAQLAASQSAVTAAAGLVALFKSLGGDWGQGDGGTNAVVASPAAGR